jgi:hypothetical protein
MPSKNVSKIIQTEDRKRGEQKNNACAIVLWMLCAKLAGAFI